MGLVGYHDIASTAIFCEGPDDQRSEEPTMNEMVDVCRVLAQDQETYFGDCVLCCSTKPS